MKEGLSYKKAGVDIDLADATKRAMARSLETPDKRVLNKIGAFATLFDGRFPGYEHPVLVFKTDEPGSKQKLALQYGRVSSLSYDLAHHLINDVIVMGATPLTVQDAIVCGKLEKAIVNQIVESLSEACKAQGCVLSGGETSEQPGVIEAGTYILTGSILGVVEKSKVIDGSRIVEGDHILAVASNGLHTNGYSLVRALMKEKPEILEKQIDGENFLDMIMRPHRCYWQAVKGLLDEPGLHGMAHITGGGIQGNLNRILPAGLDASIDLGRIQVLGIFGLIRDMGGLSDKEMLRTFNMGVGLAIVSAPEASQTICEHLTRNDYKCYPIGEIVKGTGKVNYHGELKW